MEQGLWCLSVQKHILDYILDQRDKSLKNADTTVTVEKKCLFGSEFIEE